MEDETKNNNVPSVTNLWSLANLFQAKMDGNFIEFMSWTGHSNNCSSCQAVWEGEGRDEYDG